MEWTARQYLEVQGAEGDGARPQCGAFHHSQALFAAAVGQHITEFDALTGCKLSILELWHIVLLAGMIIKSWDRYRAHDQENRQDLRRDGDTHCSDTTSTVAVVWNVSAFKFVGTIEGAKPATIIKTDLEKPVTGLACHPRSPLLFVASAERLIRAYHIQSLSVQYILQIDMSMKLVGAGAIAFHPTLEWGFCWQQKRHTNSMGRLSPNTTSMIGITQAGSNPISALAWHSMLRLLVWRTRVILSSNKHPMRANIFQSAGIQSLYVAMVLAQCSGDTIYPFSKFTDFLLHLMLNMATSNSRKEKREEGHQLCREKLFSVLQTEKRALLGSAGILPDYQLQMQLIRYSNHVLNSMTMSDFVLQIALSDSYLNCKNVATPSSLGTEPNDN
ncbi:hypothetical protein SELMODRAFT_425298 [Selaginella moellendorffii]|uniref:Uncharacterized protein n=1 Tax=Selaginella moellendorffii TaxID=88036 RepID=D8SSN2_SELML|nr:hypothetical protein SELMODRAFT_425298 [Selaginella moellendorffii]